MYNYCVIPEDCRQFWWFVDSLPLNNVYKETLKSAKVIRVNVSTEPPMWEIVIKVNYVIPGDVLKTVSEYLCNKCSLKKVIFHQINFDITKYLTQNWASFCSLIAGQNPTVKHILQTADWNFIDNILILNVIGEISVEILKAQEIDEKIILFLQQAFDDNISLRFNSVQADEAVCVEEDLYTPEYVAALNEIVCEESKQDKKDYIILGKNIRGEIMEIKSIQEEVKSVVFEGRLLNFELKELRSGRFLLTFDMVDATDGISAKTIFDNKDLYEKLNKRLKKNMYIKVKGSVKHDKFANNDLILFVDSIEETAGPLPRIDNSETKRVELHVHTKMSSLDSVASTKSLIATAAKWGHPAIAITDHGVVQAFPEAHEVASSAGIKVIYGMEGYMLEDENSSQSYHIVILAKNAVGLRNLYRLVSISHLKYLHRKPRIPRFILEEHREGLLFGSACEAGDLIQAIINNEPEEKLLKIASFYDYLEIQPTGNNGFLVREGKIADEEGLRNINRKVCELGEKLGKLVVATCDVHFLNPEDEVYRRILMTGQGYLDADNQPPLYLRTTEEMLNEFSYLGVRKAQEVVIENTHKINSMIEVFKPIPDELYSPQIPGAEEQIKTMSYKRAKELYGDPLPEIVSARLTYELDSIINNGFAVLYLIAHKLVKKSLDDGYLVGSRGSVGSSFVAHMTDITEVNALPPHWLCPNCKYSKFVTDGSYGSGFDMPDKNCPQCGTLMKKNGHDIPFAVFMGFHGDKVPDIDLNFSGDYQPVAHKYTEELFGRDNVFRAGTIATIADKTAYGFVKNYFNEKNINPRNALINSLVEGCTGVKRTTGQHPGGIMVVPRDMDVHFFTPIQYPADDKNSGTITTHFDYHSISSRLVKLDILGHDDPTVIRMLEDLTGIDPKTIPFDDKPTLSLFNSTEALNLTPEELGSTVGTFGIPEYGTKFVRQMLEDTMPKNFSELVRISGFSHGTDVWLNNAQALITAGTAKLSEAISARDDIMVYLIQKGVEPSKAFKIMESVRKGKGVKPEDIVIMKENNVPDWYIESCQKIKYMFPKAHAVAYVMMAFRIAYFKVHYPKAFYAAYFTVRATEFDADLIVQGERVIRNKLKEFEMKGNSITAKEKNLLTILEMSLEMYLRGFKFSHVDLYNSDATKFIITDEGLLPPLAALQGLGDNAAKNIVTAREEKPFSSIEDLKNRAHVSKTVIEILKNHGCLSKLPETDQLELFA